MIKLLDNSINAVSKSISYLLRQKYQAREVGYPLEERQISDLIQNMQDTLTLLAKMREKEESND